MLFQKTTGCFTALILMSTLIGCVPSGHIEKRPIDVETCDADTHRSLLWKPSSVLSATSLPKQVRIIHPGQVVTADYRMDRLNIKIGKLDRIEQVFCG